MAGARPQPDDHAERLCHRAARPPHSPVTPGPPIFADGFESGNLAAWTSSTGLVMQTVQAHSGRYAVEATTTNGHTYAKKVLSRTYADGWARLYFNLLSYSSRANLLC
jgi:hypothetical protein